MAKNKTIKLSELAAKGVKAVKARESKEDRELESLRKKIATKKKKQTAAKQKLDKHAEIKRLKAELKKL